MKMLDCKSGFSKPQRKVFNHKDAKAQRKPKKLETDSAEGE